MYSPHILYIIFTYYLVHFRNSNFMYQMCIWRVVCRVLTQKNTLHIRYGFVYSWTKDTNFESLENLNMMLYIVRKVLVLSDIDDVASCIAYFFWQGKTFLHIFESLMRSHSWFVCVKNYFSMIFHGDNFLLTIYDYEMGNCEFLIRYAVSFNCTAIPILTKLVVRI